MALGDVMYQLRIRDLREDRDLSQTQVAELLKVHQTTYSDYELGRLNVPVSALHTLADYYGVSIRENYIPATSRNYSTVSGYHTETTGYVERSTGSILGGFVTLMLVLLVIWMILDAMRWSRYRRR